MRFNRRKYNYFMKMFHLLQRLKFEVYIIVLYSFGNTCRLQWFKSQLHYCRPGVLTKSPSSALHDVTLMTNEMPQSLYDDSGLADYFTVGLHNESSGRTSQLSIARTDKHKISNKCKNINNYILSRSII